METQQFGTRVRGGVKIQYSASTENADPTTDRRIRQFEEKPRGQEGKLFLNKKIQNARNIYNRKY